MLNRGSPKKRRFNAPNPTASQYGSATHPPSAVPLVLGSSMQSCTPLLSAGPWMHPGQSLNAYTGHNSSGTRPEITHLRPAQQMPITHPQGVEIPILDARAYSYLTTVPPAPILGSNHGLRDSSRNAILMPAPAPAPLPSYWAPRSGPSPLPGIGYSQSALALSTLLPLPIAVSAQPTERFPFINETPANIVAKPEKRRRTTAQGQAVKSTLAAGGACIWCQAKKKGCGDLNPCESCARNGAPCIRGFSVFSLASTIKHNGRQQLDPDNFQQARDIMTQLKENSFGNVPYTSAFVNWTLYHPQQDYGIWDFEHDKLDPHQLDPTVKASLIDLALGFVTVPRFETAFSDTLYESTLKTVKLFAAISQLSRSEVLARPMAVGIARMTVFFLLTLYAMEMCEASRCSSDELCDALKDRKRSTEPSVRYSMRVYSQLISEIMAFQPSGSLISGIFAPIRSRLKDIQHTIQKTLSFSALGRGPDAHGPVVSRFLHLEPFDIAIGFRSPLAGTAGSRQDMCHDQMRYPVNILLREDFDEGMVNTSTALETIDPQLILRPATATQSMLSGYHPSSNPYSAETFNNNIFSPAEGSQSTGLTSLPQYDGAVSHSPLDSLANEYLPSINSGEAFSNMGTQFWPES